MSTEIPIIFSDEHIVLVNKPEGLLSVPGRGEDKWDCVIHRVQKQFPTARIVHRLDCATSGLMVIALDADSHRELSRQFRDREVNKLYEAMLFGRLDETKGIVDQPLITDWPNRPRQKICHETGKSSQTHFELKSYESCHSENNELSRVCLKPITGRSHQLRVHMQYLGYPIIGDQLYASNAALSCSDRLCLHATYLQFSHPDSKQELEFHNDAPF